MNRRALLVSALSLAAQPAAGKKRRKHKKRDRNQDRATEYVTDETSDGWAGVAQHQAALFNAIMPPRGPRIVVIDAPHRLCADDFSMCSSPVLPISWAAGLTYYDHVALRDAATTEAERNRIVCHEWMHKLTGVGDAYTYDPATGITTWWTPGLDSCVHGTMSAPGAYDRALLEQRFSADTHKKHTRRKHR